VFLGLVAPRSGIIPRTFVNVCPDAELHEALVSDIQRFRGRVYRTDGSIPASALDEQGRHWTPVDRDSWHLILLDRAAGVCGCVRATLHPDGGRLSNLKLREVIVRIGAGGDRYAAAVEAFLANAHRLGRGAVEVGGWAVHEGIRNTTRSPILVLAVYSLAQVLGGGVIVSVAGRINHSADILHRLGGFPLADEHGPLPAFYDAHHQCELELLGYDPYHPPEEYEPTVLEIREFLRNALVVTPSGTPVTYPPGRTDFQSVRTDWKSVLPTGRDEAAGHLQAALAG
jgi:hypothetical protein